MKSTICTIVALLLVGCVQTGQASGELTFRQAQFVERVWDRSFLSCKREILKNRSHYRSIGIVTDEQEEDFCACYAHKLANTVAASYSQGFHILEGIEQRALAECETEK